MPFRLKNILHEKHEITPKCEYEVGLPHIRHSWRSNLHFRVLIDRDKFNALSDVNIRNKYYFN